MSGLFELFKTFFIIGLSAFGGGYAVIPLIQHYIVESKGWISVNEMIDITSISQMTPGPIFINAATFVGIKVEGLWGGLIATLGSVLPGLFIVLMLAYLFNKYGNLRFIQNILKGLKPTIVALIWMAALGLVAESLFISAAQTLNLASTLAFLIAIWVSLKTKADTLLIVGIGGLVGFIFYLF
jgi:chromate transporter